MFLLRLCRNRFCAANASVHAALSHKNTLCGSAAKQKQEQKYFDTTLVLYRKAACTNAVEPQQTNAAINLVWYNSIINFFVEAMLHKTHICDGAAKQIFRKNYIFRK